MKALITVALATLFLTSCGSIKKHSEEEQHKKEIASLEVFNTNYNVKQTIEFDTLVNVKGGFYLGSIDYKSFIDGKPVITEDGRQKTETHYDKKSNRIIQETKIKDAPVNIKAKKVTESNVNTKGTKKVKYKADDKKQVKDKIKESLYTSAYIFVFIFLILIVILYFIIKNKKASALLGIFYLLSYALISCSPDENNQDKECNCKEAIYKNIYTGVDKIYNNEPVNCDTGQPYELSKDNVFAYSSCQGKPTY